MKRTVYFHIYYFLLDNDRQILKRESEISLQDRDSKYVKDYFHAPHVMTSCCLEIQIDSKLVFRGNCVVSDHP
jgi:hypothetical protein